MEEKYWELRENVDRAWDEYNKNPNRSINLGYDIALREYTYFCVEVLERLMDENSDVLARLKA